MEIREPKPCIACYKPVTTYIIFEGTDYWMKAALVGLGVPFEEARTTIEYLRDNVRTQGSWWTQTIVACAECGAKAGMDVGPRPDGHVPNYRQPLEGSFIRGR